ncbi:M24 family metallopeptidase, partial [archaeon]
TVDSMFLCDSGGQYVDGTTDVTRTLHFGAPTPHERACFTRVLQGHIALARAKFPVGASGVALDAIARAAVWAGGLDYAHGTGHGVGACLNVHEGPFGAASAPRNTYTGGIQAYMTLSDEPGYYEQGAFGIRIENVLLSVPCTSLPAIPNGKPFLEFESLTVVPVSTNLIEPALLSPAELAWLNAYHASVREKLAPLMQSEWAREYLMRVTQPPQFFAIEA